MRLFNFRKKQQTKEDKLYASSRSFQLTGTRTSDGRYVSAEEIYQFIANFLSPLLEIHRFKYLKSKHIFKRYTETGCDEIAIHFVDHTHYHVSFIFMKRINKIQKIITAVNYENGFNTIKNYKEHFTIMFTDSNSKTEVISFSVLEKALQELSLLMEKHILPYFETLNSLEVLSQSLNYPEKDKNNPFSFWSTQMNDNSVINGLIVAKVLNDSNYDKLFDNYITLCAQNLVLKEKLLKLRNYLRQKNLSEL